jgi:hypothetical protein
MLHKDTKNKKIDANFLVTLQVSPLTSHSPSRSMNPARSPDGMNTARSARSSDGMNTARSTDSKFHQLEMPLVTMATVFQQYGDLVHYKQVLCICVGSLSFSPLSLSLSLSTIDAYVVSARIAERMCMSVCDKDTMREYDLMRKNSQQGDFILHEYLAQGDMMFIESGVVEAVVINHSKSEKHSVHTDLPVSAAFIALSVCKNISFG